MTVVTIADIVFMGLIKRISITLPVVISGALLVSGIAQAAIDTQDKEAVRASYINTLKPALIINPTPLWTGSIDTCNAGVFHSDAQAATFTAVNWYREMNGLLPVTEDATGSRQAQQAALIMAAANRLTHYPTSDMKCFSDEGYTGASTSNLAWGSSEGMATGANAIRMYMNDDKGSSFGHQNWILKPETAVMGAGSTSTTNALKVVWSASSGVPFHASVDKVVSWPSAGWFPYEELPDMWNIREDSITSVTLNGQPISVSKLSREEIEYPPTDGFNTYTLILKSGRSVEVKVFNAIEFRAGNASIVGEQRVGKLLKINTSNWGDDVSLDYAWKRNGKAIKDTDGIDEYKLTPADLGSIIEVEVIGSRGSLERSVSVSTNKIGKGIFLKRKARIIGVRRVGKTVRVRSGSWPVGTKLTYTWALNGKKIPRATKPMLRITSTMKHKKLSVQIVAKHKAYVPIKILARPEKV